MHSSPDAQGVVRLYCSSGGVCPGGLVCTGVSCWGGGCLVCTEVKAKAALSKAVGRPIEGPSRSKAVPAVRRSPPYCGFQSCQAILTALYWITALLRPPY